MIKRPPLRVAVIWEIVAILVLVLLYNVGGSGFAGKSLWDWFQLLIVPLILLLGGIVINSTIQRSERQQADERAKVDREIATDRLREQALQTYFDHMSEMLLKDQLYDQVVREEAKTIARARTLTVLRGLDGDRKGAVLSFLYESGLISGNTATVSLKNADFSHANLQGAFLMDANLAQMNLQGAILQWATLDEVNFDMAHLQGANLQGALCPLTHLLGTNLHEANLKDTDFQGAHFQGTILYGANLTGASVTQEQLAQAFLDEHAILPDGTHYVPPAKPSQDASQ